MNRVSIGVRLALAFSFVVSIRIVVGWFGLNRMARINADLNDINYRRWSKLQLAQEALTYSNMNNRLLQGAILSGRKEEIASLLNQRERNTKRITDIIQTLNQHAESARERELLRQVDHERAAALEDVALIINLLRVGKYDKPGWQCPTRGFPG